MRTIEMPSYRCACCSEPRDGRRRRNSTVMPASLNVVFLETTVARIEETLTPDR
jgi:hypothetical protein